MGKEPFVRTVELPTGPLGVVFVDGSTKIKELREGSAIAGKVHVGECVSKVKRPGFDEKVDCSKMTGTELSEILVADKDSPGRSIDVTEEGLVQIKIPSGNAGVVFKPDSAKIAAVKPTSPLLGQINPGDLLVSVDDKPIPTDAGKLHNICVEALQAADTGTGERKLVFKLHSDETPQWAVERAQQLVQVRAYCFELLVV